MSKKKGYIHRIGDLIEHVLYYDNGIPYVVYGKIIDILDDNGESHSEYTIITGWGDANSKVAVVVKTTSGVKASYGVIKELNEDESGKILHLNPHKFVLVNNKYEINKLEEEIKIMEQRIDFLYKNRNREDKLNELLDEK